MRYISEQFKAIQSEIIRPALKLRFEIDTDITNVANGEGTLGFDDTVAPVVPPKDCTNEHYYAVVGDGKPVDDPNRICAPDNSGDMSEPTTTVPYGVTPYTSKNSLCLIGDSTTFYNNFVGFETTAVLCFKGGHLPSTVYVQRYDRDTDTWEDEAIIDNIGHDEELSFPVFDISHVLDFRRFYAKNTSEGGRFKFNWLKRKNADAHTPIVFENDLIVTASVSQETDLTSQTLPSYEMTVECRDVDGIYTPDSAYWKNQFQDGTPCFIKAGYEINGVIEYVPLLYGKLTQAPTYDAEKLTFKASVDWNAGVEFHEFWSLVNHDLNTGDVVDNRTFENYMWTTDLFNDYSDAFADQDDIDNSVCNYYGEIDSDQVRQLVANALGCFITAGINRVDLHNSNNLQYKKPYDVLSRLEQVQNTLESQPKVGKIVITRNENTLSSNSYQIEASERAYVRPDEVTYITYKVPFYAIGKFIVNDYQKSVPTAAIQADYGDIYEEIGSDGMAVVRLGFEATQNTYIQPIVTFYGVDDNKFEETEHIDNGSDETYENSNVLITNGYTAGKANRIAHLVNDIPNKYEVDVIQDYRYEVGDIIRLETQKNVYKTCVITGLNFAMPGSSGHVSCREIFSLLNCPYADLSPIGLKIDTEYSPEGERNITVLETSEDGVILGVCKNVIDLERVWVGCDVLFILGATKVHQRFGAIDNDTNITSFYTDLNGHDWGFLAYPINHNTDVVTSAQVVALPDFNASECSDPVVFGLTNLIRQVYSSQGMTAPVDYTCTTYDVTP